MDSVKHKQIDKMIVEVERVLHAGQKALERYAQKRGARSVNPPDFPSNQKELKAFHN